MSDDVPEDPPPSPLETAVDAPEAPVAIDAPGAAAVTASAVRLERAGAGTTEEDRYARIRRLRAIVQIVGGTIVIVVGMMATAVSYGRAVGLPAGGSYLIWYGPIVSGLWIIVRGIFGLFPDTSIADDRHLTAEQRTRRAHRDLAVGFPLVAVALGCGLAHATSLWGRGLFTFLLGLLAIGLALIARAILARLPDRDHRITIACGAVGIALIAIPLLVTPPVFANISSLGLVALYSLYASAFFGIAALAEGVTRIRRRPRVVVTNLPLEEITPRVHRRVRNEAIVGMALVTVGVATTLLSIHIAAPGGRILLAYGPIIGGFALIFHALAGGFKSFVAWRYLLVFARRVTRRGIVGTLVGVVAAIALGLGYGDKLHLGAVRDHEPLLGMLAFGVVALGWGMLRHSRPSFWMFVTGVVIAIGCAIALDALRPAHARSPFDPPPPNAMLLQILYIGKFIGMGLAALAAYFGTLRAFFTFFTVIPIVGVWVGVSALVMVLAVMSGFETDLREKILGSNAHIQITREDGDFTEWEAAKAKLDQIPGVVASTPYAVSEVVIAANNNGMNVIIKGIDAATVGKVTNLVANLEDPDALARLEPLVHDDLDHSIPQAPPPAATDPDVVDPPPPDMLQGGDPVDFSAGPGSAAPEPEPEPEEVLDPPPADLLTDDEPPVDYSTASPTATPSRHLGVPASDFDDTDAIDAADLAIEPILSGRTKSLPGVLVGRELVKQTHLYPGEEVRVVSPLSDPSNPDATGTPIPFNRDYRVAGVFYTGMYEYDLKYVYVTLDSLQQFLKRGDAVDGIEVRITDADDTGRYVPSEDDPGLIVKTLGPGYRVQDWRELNRSLFSALKLEKIAMFLVLGIVILVASFSIVGNLIMVVVEKAREIALLKTLGASDLTVTQLFAIQGLIIGLIGTALGIGTGLAGCWAGKRFGLPLNPDVYYIDKLPIHIDPDSVIAAAVAGVVISIAATLYPALLASRVRPAAGMRH